MAEKGNNTQNTTKLSNSRQLQIEYWSKRAERNFLAGEKDALEVAQGLSKNYKDAMKKIDEKINSFYGKYASQNGMSYEDAKQLLNKSELKSFKEYLDECIEYKKNNDIPSRQYELLKLKTKVTRWDELRTQLQYELDKLTVSNQEDIEQMLYDNYEEGYYKSIFDAEQFQGFSSSFNGLDKQAIERAVKTKWLGDNYSSRIWKNENSLMNILSQDLPRGLALGTNPRELSKQVSKRLNTNYNNTVRLVRTEYANVLNNSTMAGYTASGIDKYQILAALDERTCDDCDAFNEEIFEVKDAKEGINMPPFHPNCRCTTIPYFEEDEIDEMSDEELDDIGFITYDEWKEGLVEINDNKFEYRYNSMKKPELRISDLPDNFNNAKFKDDIDIISDYISKQKNINPDVVQLYKNLKKSTNLPFTLHRSANEHGLSIEVNATNNKIVSINLSLPKINLNDTESLEIWFHETGHFIDLVNRNKTSIYQGHYSSTNNNLINLFSGRDFKMGSKVSELFKDFTNERNTELAKVTNKYNALLQDINNQYKNGKFTSYSEYKSAYEDVAKEYTKSANESTSLIYNNYKGLAGLQDIYDALSGGIYYSNKQVVFGHGQRYYSKINARIQETFANYCSLSMTNPELVKLLAEDKPELVEAFNSLIKEMLK